MVEDDIALRLSLVDWLSKDYLVSSFDTSELFLKAIKDFQFDDEIPTILLLDFQMPGMNGVELQAQLRKMNLEYPILFMSGNAQQVDIIDAWHGGAVDFLLKPFAAQRLSEIIAVLFRNLNVIKPKFIPAGAIEVLDTMPISQREAEVLLLLGMGHRQHEIAIMLNVTLRTVKWHRASIKNKLGLNTLVEIARYCDQHHLLIKKVASLSSV